MVVRVNQSSAWITHYRYQEVLTLNSIPVAGFVETLKPTMATQLSVHKPFAKIVQLKLTTRYIVNPAFPFQPANRTELCYMPAALLTQVRNAARVTAI